jgi:hypothetical protein
MALVNCLEIANNVSHVLSFGFVAPEQHARGRDDVPVITEETREKIFNFLRPVLKGEPRTHEWWPIYELVSKPFQNVFSVEAQTYLCGNRLYPDFDSTWIQGVDFR